MTWHRFFGSIRSTDFLLIEVHITDFGLAKRMDGSGDLTLTGQVVGSPGYLSPEQAAGHHDRLTPASDLYSMGAILYELLTGRPPFLGQSLQETLIRIRDEEPVPPRTLVPSIPRDLETICLKCLDKAPARRFSSTEALARELDRFLEGKPLLQPQPREMKGGNVVAQRVLTRFENRQRNHGNVGPRRGLSKCENRM